MYSSTYNFIALKLFCKFKHICNQGKYRPVTVAKYLAVDGMDSELEALARALELFQAWPGGRGCQCDG